MLIFNHADTAYTIRAGDRIAQLLLEKCVFVNEIEEVESLMERGAKCFGSSGK